MKAIILILISLLGTMDIAVLGLANNRLDSARNRLVDAFSSPSGKLTYTPELVIPEPQDPTAILLLTNAVQTLSSRIREVKANAAFLHGSVTALETFTNEQESARGSFPSPIPAIYCSSISLETLPRIAQAGAEGVLVQACNGVAISSPDELHQDVAWKEICLKALECGVHPIPEITLTPEAAVNWSDKEIKTLVDTLKAMIGVDPSLVVLSLQALEEVQESHPLPTISKEVGKNVPIIGSVRTQPGENRLHLECQRFKEAGFRGVALRSDCVPGFRINPDLEIVGKFWQAVISDLKSTRSKSFSFRAKNNMDRSMADKWMGYRKSVLDSGALGDPDQSVSMIDSASGDYQGFA